MTKPQAIAIWRSGRMKFRRYETSEIRARRYGEAAVVTGRIDSESANVEDAAGGHCR